MSSNWKNERYLHLISDFSVKTFRWTKTPTSVRKSFHQNERRRLKHPNLGLILLANSNIQRSRVRLETQLRCKLLLVTRLTNIIRTLPKTSEYCTLEHYFGLLHLKRPSQRKEHVI